ncbi:pfs domain-containing protein [Histoplasma capsulatum var. duboisii H88]|uniref:Pfs domain-containing protein n=1 Tax=Ajellomyces capsulatus (strain H88) TaxID=544711 RepID=F0UP53_AJEC8|nr:pfs domain-containing protein [Histoplasma capsulatum var. duboisii H88]
MGVLAKLKYTLDSYTVALIRPKGIEFAAVEGMLEHTHPPIPMERLENAYTLGQIGNHNVVVAILSETGTSPAATAVTQTLNDFKSIRFGLLVGVGGAIPVEEVHDIRLGDVVVSKPAGTFGGVVQFDRGPEIHYGTIGSSNLVIKDGITRNKLYDELGIICVEMEAAGLMDEFPCLVVRGISDYADSHKNKEWQPYAAATAAAYVKELLEEIPSSEVSKVPRAVDSLKWQNPPDDSQRELRDKISQLEELNKIFEQNNKSQAKDIESLKEKLKEVQKEFRERKSGSGGSGGRPESINSSGVWVGMIRKEIVDAAIKGKLDEFKNDCSNLKREVLGEWTARVADLPSVHQFFAKWFHSPRLLYGPWTPDPRAVWADTIRDDAERMLAWCDDCGKNSSGYGVIAKYWTLWALFEYAGVVSATLR